MFRREVDSLQNNAPVSNTVILALAQLLAESRGRLSKENFETLAHIGGVLYKEGRDQSDARSDVAAIMKESAESRKCD